MPLSLFMSLSLSACHHTTARFRKPKHSYQHHKSEVSSRHSAFTRGSAYLERYCLLIAFGAYLEEVTAGVCKQLGCCSVALLLPDSLAAACVGNETVPTAMC